MSKYLRLFLQNRFWVGVAMVILSITVPSGAQATGVSAITGLPVTCVGQYMYLTDTSAGGIWSSSDISIATIYYVNFNTAIISGVGIGTATITYNVAGAGTTTTIVTVNGAILPIVGPDEICLSSTSTFANPTPGGIWTTNYPDYLYIDSLSGYVTGLKSAFSLNVAYTINGCSVNKSIAVPNTKGNIQGPLDIQSGNIKQYNHPIPGGVWRISSPHASVDSNNGIVTALSAGSATLNYTAEASCGTISDTIFITITNSEDTTCPVWERVGNDISNSGIPAPIALDSSGVPYVLIHLLNNNAVKFDGSQWNNIGYQDQGPPVYSYTELMYTASPQIAIGNDYKPYFAFAYGEVNKLIVMTNNNAGLWTPVGGTESISDSALPYISLALNNTSTPYVCYDNGTGYPETAMSGHSIMVKKFNGYNWEQVGPAFASAQPSTCHIAIDSTGTPYVAFRGYYEGAKVMKFDGTDWLPVGTHYDTGISAEISMALAKNGNLYLAYKKPGGDIAIIKYNGSSWDTLKTIHFTSACLLVPGTFSLALDSHDIPYIAYANCNSGGRLAVVKYSGNDWNEINYGNLSPGISLKISIAIDKNDVPYVVNGVDGTPVIRTAYGIPNITGKKSICTGNTDTLYNRAINGRWTSNNTSVATIDTTTGIVTTLMPGTAAISYTVLSCSATTVITVDGTPVAGTLSGATVICAPAATPFSSTAIGGNWSSSNTAIATVGTTGIVSATGTGAAIISYTKTNSCGTAVATRAVTVSITPATATITGVATVATGATTALSATTTGGTWSSSNIAKATVSSTGMVTGIAAGTAIISYTLSSTCGSATATRIVTVGAVPVMPITGTLSLCAGNTGAVANATAGGYWGSSAPSVATINASGMVTAIAPGTTTVSYTVAGSLATAVVTVNAAPAAIAGTATACIATPATLTNATTGGTWASSNAAIAAAGAATGIVTGAATGAVTITYTLPTGCYKTKSITINPLPAAISAPATLCTGSTATLTDATAGPATWAGSSPAVATIAGGSGVVTGASAGTTTISYTLSATGCRATTIITVTAAPAITGTAALCAGGATTLGIAGTGGTWSSSNAAVATVGSTTGVVSGMAAGNATITYAVPGCTATRVVTVSALPGAITGTLNICTGTASALGGTPAGGTWSSSNTAVATTTAAGIIAGTGTGTATIAYTNTAGCARTVIVTVAAAATISGPLTVCTGSSATLTGSAPGGTWSSSAAAIATIGAATGLLNGIATGMANITYTLGAGCRAVAVATVGGAPAVITGANAVCTGATTTLSDATPGGTWSSSNTAVATIGATTGIMSGIAPGSATITYSIGAGCYRIAAITAGTGIVTITGLTGICTGATTVFSASVTGSSWSSSNTAVASVGVLSGVVSGVAPGTATITFTPYSTGPLAGCIATRQVTVNTGVAMAAITGAPYVGTGATTTLADATPSGIWSSSNTAQATVGAGTGVVSGVSASFPTITYTVTHGACVQTATVVVHVAGSRPGAAIADNSSDMLRVFPNPTNGMFTVDATAAGTFTVYTQEGKQLMQAAIAKGANALSLPHGIAAGIYMCRYNGNDGNTAMVRLVYEQ